MTILTPLQCKNARSQLGISQSKLSKETRLSRTNLALFEVNKYLLGDSELRKLRSYFESCGCTFEADAEAANEPTYGKPAPTPPTRTASKSGAKSMDGFLVPSGLDQNTVETWLNEIIVNDQKIANIGAEEIKRHWFTGDPLTENRDEVLRLMARNYVLIRKLQGKRPFPRPATEDPENEPQVTWDLLRLLIGS